MFTPDKEIAAIVDTMLWKSEGRVAKYRKKQMLKALRSARFKRLKAEADKLKKDIVAEKGKCEICGFSYKPVLQIHHILPISEYGDNSPDNIMCLCPNCHKTLHVVYKSRFDSMELMAHIRFNYGPDAAQNLIDTYGKFIKGKEEALTYIKLLTAAIESGLVVIDEY